MRGPVARRDPTDTEQPSQLHDGRCRHWALDLASRVAAGSIVPPPITRLSLASVPAVLGNPIRSQGETVITM